MLAARGYEKRWEKVKRSFEEFCNFFPQANFPGEKLSGRLSDDNKENVISILETSPPTHEETRRKRGGRVGKTL